MKEFKPNDGPIKNLKYHDTLIFLGGTIDMGNSRNWQEMVTKSLEDKEGYIANPRRDDWDSSWKQDPTPGTPFYDQVKWELNSQIMSDIIIYNIEPDSKSPITLLEIGLFCGMTDKIIMICCPKEYYRYGNVFMTVKWIDNANHYLYENLDDLIADIPAKIEMSKRYKENS